MPPLNSLYRDLFHDLWPATPPRVTQTDIDTAEKRLGFVLPPEYTNLLKYQNGGLLKRHLSESSQSPLAIIRICGIGGDEGIDSLVDGGITRNQLLIRNWNYPAQSVIFAHQGSAGFGFDYENVSENGEPTIFCMNNDREVPLLHRRVFLNFRQLLEALTDETD